MERVYISIPMTGLDEARQREHADKTAKMLRQKGYDVVNPFLLCERMKYQCRNEYDEEPGYLDYLLNDIIILGGCQMIYMCKGWEKSKGCLAEYHFARAVGIKIIYEKKASTTSAVLKFAHKVANMELGCAPSVGFMKSLILEARASVLNEVDEKQEIWHRKEK